MILNLRRGTGFRPPGHPAGKGVQGMVPPQEESLPKAAVPLREDQAWGEGLGRGRPNRPARNSPGREMIPPPSHQSMLGCMSSLTTAFFAASLRTVVPSVVPDIRPAVASMRCWNVSLACFSSWRVGWPDS